MMKVLMYLVLSIILAANSSRRLYVTATCSGNDDSFYFDASETVFDATLSGCYAVEPDGAEANGVHVFTLNGDEQADGDMAFFATSSLTDDDDDTLVWAVGVYNDEDDSHSPRICYDQDLQDVAEFHPSAVVSWSCVSVTSSDEYEIEVQSTCNCITLPPSPAPISQSPTPTPTSRASPKPAATGAPVGLSPSFAPFQASTPVPTEVPVPTLAPTQAPTPVPTLAPTQAPAPVPAEEEDQLLPPPPSLLVGCSFQAAGAVEVISIISGVAFALGLVGGLLKFCVQRLRAAKNIGADQPAPPSESGDNTEHKRSEPHLQQQQDVHSSSPIAVGSAEGNDVRVVGYGQAALVAAQELADYCQIPGVSEAARAVSILIQLMLDNRDLTSRRDAAVQRCRSIVTMLERAAGVVDKGGNGDTEAGRFFIEEVHDAVSDLVELVKTYQNKNKLAQLLTSTLFKRRQDELEAVVDRAISHLQFGLQVKAGHDIAHLVKRSMAQVETGALAEARNARRRRKLDQIEIPEDHVVITDELLGKGGFGAVYLADYNGHNAAAKVQDITHGLGRPREDDICATSSKTQSDGPREEFERKASLRELDAMIRLRNPRIVNLYGAITSRPDRLVLVMELLVGGDLRTMLKNSDHPLPEDQCRQIIQDVCAGMTFLHSKKMVHGDLKSANVLLDGRGRAKIGDFGTSRWVQHTERTTGLATYSTNPGPITHISFAWTAPEVLETRGISKASDVYSFGMVVWEVLTRQTPWADQALHRDILLRVVRGDRPAIPAGAPEDIARMLRSCWAQEPEDRPTFPALLDWGK